MFSTGRKRRSPPWYSSARHSCGAPAAVTVSRPGIPADAVLGMDDQVARGQRLVLGQEVLGPARPARLADQPVAEHVLLGDDRDARRLEAALETPDGEVDARLHLLPAGDRPRARKPVIGQQSGDALARALGIRGDDDGAVLGAGAAVLDQRLEDVHALLLALGRERRPMRAPASTMPGPSAGRSGEKRRALRRDSAARQPASSR